MRTRSRSRHKITEPLRIEFHSQEDQFQEDPPEVSMADNRTMTQLLKAPTVGYEDAIVIPEIAATNFELKYGLINLVQNKQFFGHDKEDPHAHIHYFNKITSTMRVLNVPNSTIKLMLFSFSIEGAAPIWLEKEPPRSILTWDDLVSKFINQFFPPSKMTNLRNEITRFQQSKSKVRQSRAKAVVAKVNLNSSIPAISSDVAELKDMVKALLLDKKNQSSTQATSPTPAPIKEVESNCVTCGGTHSYQNCPATSRNVYQDNINEPPEFPPVQNNQNNFNRGNTFTQNRGAPIPQTQNVSQTNFERYVKANDAVLRNIQIQGQSTQTQCQNIQNQYQTVQNQLANLTDMMSKFMSSNMASSSRSGTLPRNTVTNPKEDLKGITTRSGVAYQGPTIPTPSKVVKQGTEVTKDQVQTPSPQSTSHVQPPVTQFETPVSEPIAVPVSASMPNLKSSIPYPSRRDNERRHRSVSKPISIAKNVKVKVGMFHFPADFVVVDFEPDPRVPLILERCFLKTGHALIDEHKGELTLQIRNEAITYNLDQTSRYSANYDQMTANKIDVTDKACEEYFQEVLGFSNVTASGSPTPSDDPIVSTTSPTLTPFGDSNFLLFKEANAFLGLEDDPDSPELDPSYYDPEGVI
nr:reverse transcriptase domain-containing protein [Tanacetum cinerariifolium]